MFLINEERNYLGHRVNDLLTGMQDLQDDMENLGTRHLNKMADLIVNQIRKILHDQWSPKSQKHLRELQRIAVAIKRTIEEKGDLREVLPAAVQATQKVAGQLGVKVHGLEAPEIPGGEVSQDDFELTGTGEQPPIDQVDQQQPPMQPGMQQPPMQPGMQQPPMQPGMQQPPMQPGMQQPM